MQLDEWIKREQLTLEDAAGKFGCSIPTVSRLRRGLNKPDWALAGRIFEATQGEVTPNDFAAFPEPSQPEPTPSPDAAKDAAA